MNGTPFSRPHSRWFGTVLAFMVAIAITAIVTMALHARVSADDETTQREPMPVSSTIYSLIDGYTREQRFLGLVQAATRSQIGFEVPGAVAEVSVQEGQTVAAGTALATLDTQALEARHRAAESAVRQVQAELELARSRTQRQAPLVESGAVSAQSFDDTRLAEKALVSALEAARAQTRSLAIDLEKSVLRAPYAARIGRQFLDRGAVTQPGTPMFSLTSVSEREAHIGVAVEQAAAMQTGRGYPISWRDETVQAELRAVRSDVNPVSMTTVAIFALPAHVDAFDGEPVSVSIPRNEREPGGWLPLSALIEGERGVWTVLALRNRGAEVIALREVVEVLHVSGDRAFVRGSLNDADRVIADGVHRIAPGTAVDAQPPALARAGEF